MASATMAFSARAVVGATSKTAGKIAAAPAAMLRPAGAHGCRALKLARATGQRRCTVSSRTALRVAAGPQPETDTDGTLDFPQEWLKPGPSRRPDIFPEFTPIKQPMPQPMPGDPEEPEEEEEKERDPDNPDEEEQAPPPEEE